MKKVFSNSEVAHVWARQSQQSGRGSGSIYFEGKTIYSYGSHFPIATIQGEDVFFTLRGYSNTTSKHILYVRRAITHQNIIDCYLPPVPYGSKPFKKQNFTDTHEKNVQYWKEKIAGLFAELGNKKNRDISGRISGINSHIADLTKYCDYFKLKIKDKELKKLLKLATQPDFLDIARKATEKEIAARGKKMQEAEKAYGQYLDLWRKFDDKAITDLPDTTKYLIRYYGSQKESFTRLRFNTSQNRVETSKGVQIPAEIAKRAYKQLNECIEGTCNEIAVPVMDYTITKTTKDAIIAGCHTIPKEDVRYIAELLKW